MTHARSRGLVALFLALALLEIVPIWTVKYVPTGDGPSHVYNAWVMHALARGDAPPKIEAAYRIDWRPHPNWTGHAFMALAMFVVPPLVAEKLLLTLIIVAVLAGSWMLMTAVDPRNDVYAFLALAFTYPQAFFAGFFNYSLSIGLFLIILTVWWRRRDRPGVATLIAIAALLVLCYFTHVLATAFACAVIGLLSLFRRRPAHLLSLVPAGLLLAWFARTSDVGAGQPVKLTIDWDAASILAKVDVLNVFDLRQRPISLAISVIYAVLIVVTLLRERRRRRRADGLALLALLFAVSMFWLPAPAPTRELFTTRTAIFILLMLPAWFTPQLTRRWRAALVCVMSVIAIANAIIHFERFRHFGHELAGFIRTFDVIEPESAMLPLFYVKPYSESLVPLYSHAISYVALEKRLVDLGNYEPGSNYFPVASRLEAVDASTVEIRPGAVDLARYAPHAEWVATMELPEGQQRRDLEQRYRLVEERESIRIYRRRDPLTTPHDLILLPLLGTRYDIGAPHGARWRVDQSIRNAAHTPVRVIFRNCLDGAPCDLTLTAGMTRQITSGDARTGFLLVPRSAARSLDIRTVVRRADVDRPDLSVPIPAVHESLWKREALRIRGIETHGHRLGLRAYLFSERPGEEITLRLRHSNTKAIVGERQFYMNSFAMHENANLDTDFQGFASRAETVDIEIVVPPDARIWAFATALNEQGQTRVHLPER